MVIALRAERQLRGHHIWCPYRERSVRDEARWVSATQRLLLVGRNLVGNGIGRSDTFAINKQASSYVQQPTAIQMQQPTAIQMQQPTAVQKQQPTAAQMQQPTSVQMQQPTAIQMQQPTAIQIQQATD
ncbi:MAG: hypothetical protein RSA55_08480, partial [Clostridia bacterium]